MNRHLSVFLVLILITAVLTASLIVLYEKGFLSPRGSSIAESPRALWQRNLENFTGGFAVADGKVFVPDSWGNVTCFDARNGESIWTRNLGEIALSKIQVYEGKVYVGTGWSVVTKLDENTGNVELTFKAPYHGAFEEKPPRDFFVTNGKVFASQNGIAVYDAANGDLFWEKDYILYLGNASSSKPENNFIFIWSNSRVNPNNGSILWSLNARTLESPVVAQEKVIFWNCDPMGSSNKGQTMLCVNASSGETLWSFSVGVYVLQPIVSNGLVLFGAEDGYFYAVDLKDGLLKWRTQILDQNMTDILSNHSVSPHPDKHIETSLPQVDPEGKEVFWSIILRQDGQEEYNATVWSLDLSNGKIDWSVPLYNKVIFGTGYPRFTSVTATNSFLYVTVHTDLYCIDKETAEIKFNQIFEHYLLSPLVADNKVFVVADLYLIAYG